MKNNLHHFRNILMKLSTMYIILVLGLSPALATDINAQSLKETSVKLKSGKYALKNLFDLVEDQTQFNFTYYNGNIDLKSEYEINGEFLSLFDLLYKLSSEYDLKFNRVNQSISVIYKPVDPAPEIVEQITVNGVVTDTEGQPLPGASIMEVGTNKGTATDFDGKFSIEVSPEATLEISFMGFETQLYPLNNQSNVTIQLTPSSSALDEILVVGYGTETRRNVTGAISSVEPEEIISQPKANVVEMLDSRMPGVQVMSDGKPGGGVALRIRGFSTINSNDPLIIVDGIPVSSNLNVINPADIETIQVLKDAASASIYGSRAANGVVIITTKKGKKSEQGVQVSFNGYVGAQDTFNLPEVLNAQQYGDALWQAFENDGRTPSSDFYGNSPNGPVIGDFLDADQMYPTADTDWLDEITQTSLIQSYDVSLSKADENGSHLFSLGYYDQEGVLKYTNFKRYSARLNNSYKVTDFLTIGENFTGSYKEGVSVATNAALGSIIIAASDYLSIYPVYDTEGNFALNPVNLTDHNPLSSLYRSKDNKNKTVSLLGNLYAELDFDHFNFKSSFGLDYQSNNYRGYSPSDRNTTGSLSTTNNFGRQFSFTNTLNYKNIFGDHALDILVGQEAIEYYYEGFGASRQNFLYDDPNFRYLDFGSENQINNGNANGWALNSYFGRVNYKFAQKYLVTATVRRDGSSRFSGDNKWGTFPAFSLGWRLDKESFFNNEGVISSLLLRGSWGQTGNQDIASYATVDSYRNNNANSNYPIDGSQGAVYTGLTQSRIPNPDLKWETTSQTDIGIDLGLLDDKLNITADYYDKRTKDILVYRPVPITYGGTNDGQWVNDGEMKNIGVELNVDYADNIGDLGFDFNVNLTHSKNELTALTTSDYLSIPTSALHTVNFDQEISRSVVGQPIGSFFGYKADGLFQSQDEVNSHAVQPNAQPGDIRFVDINGDGELNDDDRTFIGSPHPDLMLGMNLKFYYKNFDMSMFFSGSFGNDIYNFLRYRGHFFNQSTNKLSDVLNAWTPDNTNTDVPRLSLDDPNNNIRPSSYYVEDGSYVRLTNMQIGYMLPKALMNDMQLRIYLQGSNLFTITDYSGMNPQVGLQNYSGSNRNLDIGADRGLYPPNRTFVLGCNLNF
tara:strand:- start:2642 stop:6034 length:3393 start_codon:yes stop_codon:yes gene_type:complete